MCVYRGSYVNSIMAFFWARDYARLLTYVRYVDSLALWMPLLEVSYERRVKDNRF